MTVTTCNEDTKVDGPQQRQWRRSDNDAIVHCRIYYIYIKLHTCRNKQTNTQATRMRAHCELNNLCPRLHSVCIQCIYHTTVTNTHARIMHIISSFKIVQFSFAIAWRSSVVFVSFGCCCCCFEIKINNVISRRKTKDRRDLIRAQITCIKQSNTIVHMHTLQQRPRLQQQRQQQQQQRREDKMKNVCVWFTIHFILVLLLCSLFSLSSHQIRFWSVFFCVCFLSLH